MAIARDDRIFPSTRIISAGIIILLVLAFLALYVVADQTEQEFAWTIMPRTSAILIGAGYLAGAYFFVRLIFEKQWHRVQAGFLPITAFTICMLAATFLHLARFHQGTLIFYLWTVVYILTPLVVPFVWWRNHSTESDQLEKNDVRFSSFVRRVMGAVAVVAVLGYIFVFIFPSVLISISPWKLTELTARVFSGWAILTSATALSIALDGRWSAARILLESGMVGILLTLLGLPRMWQDLDQTNPVTFIFVASIPLALVAFFFVHLRLDMSAKAAGGKG